MPKLTAVVFYSCLFHVFFSLAFHAVNVALHSGAKAATKAEVSRGIRSRKRASLSPYVDSFFQLFFLRSSLDDTLYRGLSSTVATPAATAFRCSLEPASNVRPRP